MTPLEEFSSKDQPPPLPRFRLLRSKTNEEKRQCEAGSLGRQRKGRRQTQSSVNLCAAAGSHRLDNSISSGYWKQQDDAQSLPLPPRYRKNRVTRESAVSAGQLCRHGDPGDCATRLGSEGSWYQCRWLLTARRRSGSGKVKQHLGFERLRNSALSTAHFTCGTGPNRSVATDTAPGRPRVRAYLYLIHQSVLPAQGLHPFTSHSERGTSAECGMCVRPAKPRQFSITG
ncbi:hypothetical protein SKAU_G00173520 [Synaphobranchus kaupii]|uniref:Uncharacterized protein n=1 Tax=Synaphobranchus kaupii TaxID=118154 RepID=A0A9Q1J131_SYNKA|nr:hypothetical protein SKAU_G00173520 [Synaphobranchus kaupii]